MISNNAALISPDEVAPEASPPDSPVQSHAYAQLKKQIRQRGLLEKQTAYYTSKLLITLALLVFGWGVLLLVHPVWLVILSAVFLGIITTQFGFLGHDAGHRQIYRSVRRNDWIGLLAGNFIMGMSLSWWLAKHNQHHSRPNQEGADPDIDFPILAFTEADARSKRGIPRFIVRHQAVFFFPLLCLESLSIQGASARYLLSKRARYPLIERALVVLHYGCYVGIPFLFLSPWEAILFLLLHQGVIGLYLGSTFAPNHKGMPIFQENALVDFLHQQVMTARNVKPHPVTDYWYGGLNYQIEHHLFPTMPRNQLKYAQPIVQAFCEEQAIPYYETSVVQSYREILQHFHRVSLSLRTSSAPA